MQFLLRIVTHILIISLIFPYAPVYAANITDVPGLVPDGSTNTVTDRAPNNTPIVNIAAPSAGGVSLNNWSDYNVTNENQILNNAKGATVNTNLAGQIYGNPNFNPSGVNEATTIVNQVTGNNRTSLNGATEVAGRKANVVIANGNGIDVAGASYINTSNLSLVTGSVNMNGSGVIDSFTLSNKANSSIIITGVNTPTYANLGLDASTVDYVDIISRSVQVLGDIHAKTELNFKLGNGTYDYVNKTISSDSNLGTTTKPTFALDSSYLGGMYVGRISLTATEAGIGVRTRGDLVSNAADIVFNVAGDIDYERLNAETNINLTSTGGKITQGKYATISRPAITYAKGNITLTGANGIELNDSSQSSNFYAAGLISLNSTSNLIKNNSTVKAGTGLSINAASFENTSLVFSSDNLSITTTGLTKNTSGSIEAIKAVTVNSGSFNNSSLIKAGTDATITSSGSFTDTNQIKATGNLSITANTGIAYNDLYSGGNLSITNNTSGDISHNYKSYSLGTTTITNNGGNIVFGLSNNSNSGSLYSKGNLTLASSLNITNNSDIFSEAKINLTAQNLTNNMRFMAIGTGTGVNSSDLTINLDQNLINYGLLYANQNINLNVDGTITNDAANNNAGEIFALNGNVNINGKIYTTSFGNVSKYDFFYLSFDKSAEIWADLLAKGYIDSNGKITDAFKDLGSSSSMNIASSLSAYKDAIYNTLANLSSKVVQNGNSSNSLDQIAKDFDSKAGDIYTALRTNGYIDSNGKVLQKFYDDTKTAGASGLSLGSDADITYLKNDIYQLLQDARNGKIIENTFLGISGINSNNLSGTLISELKTKGYIDADGNVTSTFTSLGSASALDLTSEFSSYKQAIYDQINATKSVNKASESSFGGITYQPINTVINNYSTLYTQLQSAGYIDPSGNFTNKFTTEGNTVAITQDDPNGFTNYQTALNNIFLNKTVGDAVTASDFTSVTYLPINNINDATALVNQLKTEGFIDDKGNIAEKFYTDGIASSTSSLTNYQSSINSVLGGITQASLADTSFRKITKSLDNSAARLVGELIDAGYLDSSGNKTANFNFTNDAAGEAAFATAFTSVATGGEYETVRNAIWNKLNAQNSFTASDFLGTGFDSNVLYNENQILMNNLITSGYVSNNGDVKSAFYNLSGNYTNLNLDSRFSGLKGQIGALLATTSPAEATLTNNNLVTAAQNGTRDKAGQIFNQMVTAGYLNAKGDFTQKLMDDVMNYAGTDAGKAAQLQLGSFQDYASGVYQKLKAKNGITSIKNYTTKLENLNGAKITSSLGDINIKALTLNNIAKDNKDVVSNPENGVSRTEVRGIGWAWKNTVLWGYDTVTSTLDSNQSYLRAGKNIDIEADNILNNSSIVTAGSNIGIRTSSLSNTRTQFSVSVPYIYETHWKRCRRLRGCDSGRYYNTYWNSALLRSNTPGVISSGNALNISAIGDVSIDTPTINTALVGSHPLQANSNSSTPTSSAWQIEIPTTNNGLFKKATPDKSYLIESAYNANDANTLTGSAYYKTRFGFDPNQNNIKWLGDPFYEWNAINQQIIIIASKQQQWSELNWQDNFNKLIDNAYNQQSDLSLVPGVKLTKEQIAALKSDIIWYETETITLADGTKQQVAVPHVYLAKNSISKIDLNSNNPEESVLLANNININAGGNVSNYGRILATADSKQPAGTSGNLAITSSGDITNKSTIKADNSAILTADGNITNESTVNSITIGHNGGTDIFSNIAKTATIEAGNVSINAGKDFENLAAQIKTNKNDLGNGVTSNGNFSATAGGDINISTLELRNRIETTWGNAKKGGHSVDDKITNVSSEISAAGNLSLTSTGNDVNIAGSDLSAGSDLDLIAKNNVNVTSVQNSSYLLTETNKKGMMSSKQSKDIEQQIRNISSNLEAGNNINIKSGADTNIIASNLTAANSGNITVGSYLDAATNTETINKDAVLNILSAKDSDYKYHYASSSKMDVGAIAVGMAAGALMGPVGMMAGAYIGSQAKKGQINTSEKYDETIIASNLNFGNSLNLRSASDTTIISSNLSTNSGDLNIITGSLIDKDNNLIVTDKTANLNIGVDKEVHYSNSTQEKFGGDYAAVAAGAIIAGATYNAMVASPILAQYALASSIGIAGVAGNMAQRTSVSSSSSRQENLVSSNIDAAASSLLKSQNNINIIASNYSTGADATILANNQVNLISGQETSSSSNSSGHSGGFSSVFELNQVDKIKQKSTNLNIGGDLAIVSGSDTNIVASNISGQGNATIIAGKYLDEDSSSATYNQEIYNKDASVNILNAKDATTTLSESKRSGIEFSGDYAKMAVGYAIAGPVGLAMTALEANKYKDTTGSRTEEIVQSNLTFGRSINIASASDLNVRSSNMNAGVNPNTGLESGNQGNVNLIAGLVTTTNYNNGNSVTNTNDKAKINITSDTENNYSYTVSEKSGIGGSNMDLSNDGLTFAQINRNTSTSVSSTQVASNINSSNGNINLISQDDLKIVASNVNAVLNNINQANANLGNVNLISDHGNVDILSAYNTSYSASDSFHAESNINLEINSHELALTAGVDGNGSSTTTNAGQVVSSNIIGAKVNVASGIASSYGSGLADPQKNSDKGNINIDSSNIASSRDAVTLIAANDANLLTSSNFYEQTNSSYDFSAHVRAGISYNFSELWKSIEDLKDVDPKNALKYVAISSASSYLGAGAASPYIATYGPMLASMGEGDSFDESLAQNGDYINDANKINNAGKGGVGSAGLTLELAYSQQKSGFKQSDVVSNNIFSKSDINLTSAASDLNIHSSNLNAENNINLNATKGDINILADTNNSDSFARSFAITASIPLIGKGGAGSIAFSKSKSESEDYVNSSLVAGNQFNLNSGNDTNIISSNIIASDVNMLVAGDLNLESRQNTSDSKATSFSLGGGFSSSGGGKSGSGNISYSKSVSDRDWVDNQASILGSNSVTINTGQNTNLVGSVIANITNAFDLYNQSGNNNGGYLAKNGIDDSNLTLNTNTLSYSNLHDSDFARSFGIGFGVNGRSGGSSGSNIKGNGSLTLDYSMHDYKQSTNSVIGSGNIKTGTTLNLDSNNNLIAVNGGTDYSGDLNRNITESQVLTKSLTVDPIHIKETFEFGRQYNTKNADGTDKSSLQLAAEKYANQINPLTAFANVTYGIVTDIANLTAEVTGKDPKDIHFSLTKGDQKYANLSLVDPSQIDEVNEAIKNKGKINLGENVDGSNANYFTIGDDKNTRYYFTSEETSAQAIKENPSLIAGINKIFSNGIMNNLQEASRNAIMQAGGFDQNNKIALMYDPSGKNYFQSILGYDSYTASTLGILVDLGEASINKLGHGVITMGDAAQNREFIQAFTQNTDQNNLYFIGHSAGGLVNSITLLKTDYTNPLSPSINLMMNGAPVYIGDANQDARNSGVSFLGNNINSGDFVGNGIGANNGLSQLLWSTEQSWKLFTKQSPHSSYFCQGAWCNYNQQQKP